MVTFVVEGKAVPKGRPRVTTVGGYARAYTPKKTTDYEKKVKEAFCKAMLWEDVVEEKIPYPSEAIEMSITFKVSVPKAYSKKDKAGCLAGEIEPTKKPDIDNCVKSIMDGLNGVAYTDDSQITSLHVFKQYAEADKTIVSLYSKKEYFETIFETDND